MYSRNKKQIESEKGFYKIYFAVEQGDCQQLQFDKKDRYVVREVFGYF